MTEQKNISHEKTTRGVLNYDKENVLKSVSERVIEKDPDFPKVFVIDTISYCNLRCVMCPHKEMKRKPAIMDDELYKKIIDEIAENNPDAQIWITYFGEGMMLKDLPEKIGYAVKKGVKNICFNTNGALYKKEYAERLIRAGCHRLLVGIDAFHEETYKKIRIGADFNRTVNGVLEYKKMLDEFGSPEQEVVVQFVEMDINLPEEAEFVKFWNEMGIKCKIRPLVTWHGYIEAPNKLLNNEDRLPCHWVMNTMNILDDGRVTYCTTDVEGDVLHIGNVREQTIKEIWNGTLKEIRDIQREHRWSEMPDFCATCTDWQDGYAQYV